MCGIAGFIGVRTATTDELSGMALAMSNAIGHRGPDSDGVWADPTLGVALSHRRLAIIDVSADGFQPMWSGSGRYMTVYNGEIYNYPEMRAELESLPQPPSWRGHSDTEVLLAACDEWGVESALKRANGMFAIAIVDIKDRVLILARDRMGEKPLYYGWQNGVFMFGSELKALGAHPKFAREIETRALPMYVRFGYIPAPFSIYRGIQKLPPGHLLHVPLQGSPGSEKAAPYWAVPLPESASVSEAEAIEGLDHLLRDAVRIRMHSDVPLGAFLSGGIDSSTVVALMQAQSTRAVRTYSIGFREKSFDESAHARTIAGILGTEHTEMFVSPDDALNVVPMLPDLYDEPFSDSSQIPTYLLAKLTRQHVTVALSGDGGDELFGGYLRYVQGQTLLKAYSVMPQVWRRAAARVLATFSGPFWDKCASLGPQRLSVLLSSDRLSKLAEVVALRDYQQLYGRLVSQWPDPTLVVPNDQYTGTAVDDRQLAEAIGSPIAWMMHVDQLTYLPDDILVKVDRASMAVALEARVPFLDHRLVEFASRLPLDLKLRAGEGKWLLRQVLGKYLNLELFDRPKQGFGVPLAQWLRGPLRAWAADLLSVDSLRSSGLLAVEPIRDAWTAHQEGRRNLHYPLWVILMFQAWFRRAKPGIP